MTDRTIIVGDVHGCADELDDLCRVLGFDPAKDRMVMVGDLVAKGPDSRGVLARAREWQALAVLGNHEAAVMAHRDPHGPPPRRHRPSHQALADSLSAEDWAQLESMPLWIELESGIVVHAGIVPGIPMEAQAPDDLLRIRTIEAPGVGSSRPDAGPLWGATYGGPRFVYFGHHAREGLQRHPYALGLDTGCVYGRELTAFVLPEGKLVSVPARRAYVQVPPDRPPGASA